MTKYARPISCVISGGQTGVDRAALDAALELGVLCGGYVGDNRRTEDGALPYRYPLVTLRGANYAARTYRNVRAADATLILRRGDPTPGTRRTIKDARDHQRPYKIVSTISPQATREILEWVDAHAYHPIVLNVAGPRESKRPGIYDEAYAILLAVFGQVARGAL